MNLLDFIVLVKIKDEPRISKHIFNKSLTGRTKNLNDFVRTHPDFYHGILKKLVVEKVHGGPTNSIAFVEVLAVYMLAVLLDNTPFSVKVITILLAGFFVLKAQESSIIQQVSINEGILSVIANMRVACLSADYRVF